MFSISAAGFRLPMIGILISSLIGTSRFSLHCFLILSELRVLIMAHPGEDMDMVDGHVPDVGDGVR